MESLSHSAYSSSVFVPERSRYVGPVPRGSPHNRKPSPPQGVESSTASTFRANKVRIGLTPRVGARPQARHTLYSPDTEIQAKVTKQCEEPNIANFSMHVQKLSSLSQSPVKPRSGDRKPNPSARPKTNSQGVASFDNLTELFNESDITKKYLLIKPSKLQSQMKESREERKKQQTVGSSPYAEKKPQGRKKEERKRYQQVSAEATLKPRAANPRKEDRVSVKEAMRDKEWLSKAKDGILACFHTFIQHSFGLTVSEGVLPGYKYFVGRGNNAQLVKTVLGNRWYWTKVEEEDKATANLIWTQWKEKEWMLEMQQVEEGERDVMPLGEAVIPCSVRYNPSNGPYKQSVNGRGVDLSPLSFELIFKSPSFARLENSLKLTPGQIKTHNKLESNHHLANKKALFINMKLYYECMGLNPFDYIPLTFHIKDGELDPEFQRFTDLYAQVANEIEQEPDIAKKQRNVWILKPGENTNRGTGITVCNTVEQIKEEMRATPVCPKTGMKRTFILQRYLDRPFLIHRRKFDIRLYALVTCANGVLQAYYYNEGYIRTSSKEFNINNITNKLIHLTNDAVQKFSDDYGKFEMANKLSYSDLQRYLDTHCREKGINFMQDVAPRLKALVKDTIQAVYLKVDPCHRAYSFEVFGYDFMLDENMKPWLIEVNTNPCLELSSPLLARIIPSMLDNAFRYTPHSIAIDPFFPEPPSRKSSSEVLSENRFELIFHECTDGPILEKALGARFDDLAFDDPALKDLPPDEEILSEGEAEGC